MSTVDVYQECLAQVGEETKDLLQCVTKVLQQQDAANADLSDAYFLLCSAFLVFFMQSGFAMLCAGSVRLKNVGNTMLKNLLDACGASIAWFTLGYAFAYGGMNKDSPDKTFIGNANFFLINVEEYGFWLFQYAFSATSATIVAGALAERCQMAAYLCYSMMLVGWVYPIVAHAVWNAQGFLSATSVDPLWGVGMVDFAGSGVVHSVGGLTAVYAAIVLGPRKGRFHDEDGRPLETPKKFPGHSVALQMLGSFILWFGWFGFNAGSAVLYNATDKGQVASLAAVNTALAGGCGGLSGLFVNLFILERLTGEAYFDIEFAMNGCLAGLVAIAGGCGVVEPWAAVLIGFIAGIFYIGGSHGLLRVRIDDAVDAIPVHLVNGVWGIIAIGLLASPSRLQAVYGRSDHAGWCYEWGRGSGDATLFAAQIVGLLFIFAWVSVIMAPFFVFLDWKGWFRSHALTELVGLDLSYHGGLVLGGKDEVQPEYINAFTQQKKAKAAETLRRRSNHGRDPFESSTTAPLSAHDSERELEAALESPRIVIEEASEEMAFESQEMASLESEEMALESGEMALESNEMSTLTSEEISAPANAHQAKSLDEFQC